MSLAARQRPRRRFMPGAKKKKNTMPFTRPQDRPYLVAMLKAFNKLATPPYADAARKGGVTD